MTSIMTVGNDSYCPLLKFDKFIKIGNTQARLKAYMHAGHLTVCGDAGGALEWQEGQARAWTHKKHPKHVFPGLKFASLNK